MDAMISRDAHRSHQFASVGPTGPREMHAPRPRARPFLSFSFSSSFVLPFPLILAVPPISPVVRHWFPRIAFRGQFNRSCAVGCAKWSCVLGDKWDTSFLSIGHLPADEFIRSRVRVIPPNRPIGFAETKSRDWFARTIYMCTRAERPRRYHERRSCRAARVTVVYKV